MSKKRSSVIHPLTSTNKTNNAPRKYSHKIDLYSSNNRNSRPLNSPVFVSIKTVLSKYILFQVTFQLPQYILYLFSVMNTSRMIPDIRYQTMPNLMIEIVDSRIRKKLRTRSTMAGMMTFSMQNDNSGLPLQCQ